ncbi:MAG: hypothetical protein R6V19_12830 [Armatimonadota bacterium]
MEKREALEEGARNEVAHQPEAKTTIFHRQQMSRPIGGDHWTFPAISNVTCVVEQMPSPLPPAGKAATGPVCWFIASGFADVFQNAFWISRYPGECKKPEASSGPDTTTAKGARAACGLLSTTAACHASHIVAKFSNKCDNRQVLHI